MSLVHGSREGTGVLVDIKNLMNQKVMENEIVDNGDCWTATALLENPTVVWIVPEVSHKNLTGFARRLDGYQK